MLNVIDYLTLMLINMVAGLFILAYYVYRGLEATEQKRWVPGFAITGFIALVTGFHMIFTWPLTGSYNIAYGEITVLFGILFLGAALAIAKGWELHTVTIYAFLAGAAAILIGLRIINLGMTKEPALSGIGFILTGLGGIFAAPTLYFQALRTSRTFRLLGAIVLIVAALIWALTGYNAYWGHLESFSNWVPATMPPSK